MTARTLLLAGGGHADIPMIRAARALGFRVVTSGNRAEDLGHAHADDVRLADFSNREAMLGVAREVRADGIIASCNDFSALSCAWVTEQLGLPGHDSYEVARTLHHKDLYRAFALANGIDTPQAVGCGSPAEGLAAAEGLRFPLIVKPVDLTGGKGISVARDRTELEAALAKAFAAGRAGRAVVEEFLEGSRHGFTSMLRNGKVAFHFQDNEHYFLNPYLVSAASTPAQVPPGAGASLVATTERIAALLGLVDGIVHIQYILHDGRPVIIEICRRPPGDLYVELVRHATGVDYPNLIVRPACGLNLDDLSQVEPQGAFTRHCVMSRRTGRIEGLAVDPRVRGKVIDEMMWWRPGEVIADVMTHKLGIMFFRFDDAAEMLDLTARMPDLVAPVLAP